MNYKSHRVLPFQAADFLDGREQKHQADSQRPMQFPQCIVERPAGRKQIAQLFFNSFVIRSPD